MSAIQVAKEQAEQQPQQQASAANDQSVVIKTDPEAPRMDKDGKQLSVGSSVQLLAVDGKVAAVGTVVYATTGAALDPVDKRAGKVRGPCGAHDFQSSKLPEELIQVLVTLTLIAMFCFGACCHWYL
jgi:hypothetical protein